MKTQQPNVPLVRRIKLLHERIDDLKLSAQVLERHAHQHQAASLREERNRQRRELELDPV